MGIKRYITDTSRTTFFLVLQLPIVNSNHYCQEIGRLHTVNFQGQQLLFSLLLISPNLHEILLRTEQVLPLP